MVITERRFRKWLRLFTDPPMNEIPPPAKVILEVEATWIMESSQPAALACSMMGSSTGGELSKSCTP